MRNGIRAALAALAVVAFASATADARGSSGHASASHSVSHASGSHERAPASVARDSRGRIARSTAAKDSFKRSHPCPATGSASGACPGYVIDHIDPLERGGADAPSNMQWQTIQAAKAKDKIE